MTHNGTLTGGMHDYRYLVLVLRLLVDRHGELQQGELLDAKSQTVGRFQRPEEIPGLIAAWLAPQGVQQPKE